MGTATALVILVSGPFHYVHAQTGSDKPIAERPKVEWSTAKVAAKADKITYLQLIVRHAGSASVYPSRGVVLGTTENCSTATEPALQLDLPDLTPGIYPICFRAEEPGDVSIVVIHNQDSKLAQSTIAVTVVDDGFFVSPVWTVAMPFFLAVVSGLFLPTLVKWSEVGIKAAKEKWGRHKDWRVFLKELKGELNGQQEKLDSLLNQLRSEKIDTDFELQHPKLVAVASKLDTYSDLLTISEDRRNQVTKKFTAYREAIGKLAATIDLLKDPNTQSEAFKRVIPSAVEASRMHKKLWS